MKLKLVIECVYEVDEQAARDNYGTTDPAECARIDAQNMTEDPDLLFETLQFNDQITSRVEVVS